MVTATITFKVKNDKTVETIEAVIELIGKVVDLSMEYDTDAEFIKNSIQCHYCLKLVEPKTYSVPFKTGKGFHIKADCPDCGKFIKFIKQ